MSDITKNYSSLSIILISIILIIVIYSVKKKSDKLTVMKTILGLIKKKKEKYK